MTAAGKNEMTLVSESVFALLLTKIILNVHEVVKTLLTLTRRVISVKILGDFKSLYYLSHFLHALACYLQDDPGDNVGRGHSYKLNVQNFATKIRRDQI